MPTKTHPKRSPQRKRQHKPAAGGRIRRFVRDNALLLAFTSLFILCLAGQAISGAVLNDATRQQHGLSPLSHWRYLATGTFLQGMFANWQAAILQLGSLILLGVHLRQRGDPHSIKGGKAEKSGSTQYGPMRPLALNKRKLPDAMPQWLHDNSLSIAFVVLFAVTFALHALSGAAAYNVQRGYDHLPRLSLMAFVGSAKFWFTTLQTWEAEYMAIALYILLSIFLRQKGSPESKPPEASNADTGHPNE